MISIQKELNFNACSELYDALVNKDRFLPRFHDEVDLSFVFNELVDRYCPDNGRPAIDPVFLFKCLIIKVITNLSDQDLMEEIRVNLEYKYFLDMAPMDLPPDSSTLCVFRRQRLKDENMMDLLLSQTLKMAMERGIIKRSNIDGKAHINIIMDATHTESMHGLCRPVPMLKQLSEKLRFAIYTCEPTAVGELERDHDISNTSLIEELAYGHRLLDSIENRYPHLLSVKKVSQKFNRFKELLEDVADHYSVNPADADARVGHKSADTEFFGYKSHIAIDEDSRLIIDAEVTSGEVGDAIPGKEIVDRIARKDDLKIDEMLGDTAYSGQPFLESAENNGFKLIAPAHPNLGSGIDGRDGFTFNKDADMFCCPKGHMAIAKRTATYKRDNNRKAIIYTFDKNKCAVCPLRSTCLKGKAKARTFSVSVLTAEQKRLLKDQQTEYFKLRRRQRYKIEQKNAHLKQGYSMSKTQGKGIEMMSLQAAVAFFTSNIKIILAKK